MAEKVRRQQLEVDQQVIVTSSEQSDRQGIIRYLGPVQGQPGTWVGVELEKDEGKHDGSYNDKHGIFVRAHQIKPASERKTSILLKQPSKGLKKPQVSSEENQESEQQERQETQEDQELITKQEETQSQEIKQEEQDKQETTEKQSKIEKRSVLKRPGGNQAPKVATVVSSQRQIKEIPQEESKQKETEEFQQIASSNVTKMEIEESTSKVQTEVSKYTKQKTVAKEETQTQQQQQEPITEEQPPVKNVTSEVHQQSNTPGKQEKEELKYEAVKHETKQPTTQLKKTTKVVKTTPNTLQFQKQLTKKDEESDTNLKLLRQQLQQKDDKIKQQEQEIEHLSMEKELQEANVETLQLELENANTTIEELKFHLEQKQNEQEQLSQMNIEVTDKDQLILAIKKLTIEQQAMRVAYDKKIESLEKEINTLQEYEEQAALLGDVLNQMAEKEELINNLQEQVDEASEYQKLIENYSENNEKKDIQIQELEEKIQEMEELVEMQQKVAEDQELLQLDLYNEISTKEVEIANLKASEQIFAEEKNLIQLQIERYKEKIQELTKSLQDSKNTIEKIQEQSQDAKIITDMYEKMQWYAAQQKNYLSNRITSGITTIKSQFSQLKSDIISSSLPEQIFQKLGIPCFNKMGLIYQLKNSSLNLFLEIVQKENQEKTLNPVLASILKLLKDLYKSSDNLYFQCCEMKYEDYLKLQEETYWGNVQASISGIDQLSKLFIEDALTNQVNIDSQISMAKILNNISKEKPRSLKIELISKILEIVASSMQSEQLQVPKIKNLITNLQNTIVAEEKLTQTLKSLEQKVQERKWIDQELNYLQSEIDIGTELNFKGPWDFLAHQVKQQIDSVLQIQKERDEAHAKYKEIAQQFYSAKKELSEQLIINKTQEKRLQETINKAGKSIELQAEIDQQKEQISKLQTDIESLQQNLEEKINQINDLKQQQVMQQATLVKKPSLMELQSPKFTQMPIMQNLEAQAASTESQIEILKLVQQEKVILQSQHIRNIMDNLQDLLPKKQSQESAQLQNIKKEILQKMAVSKVVSLKEDTPLKQQLQKQQDESNTLRLQAHKLGVEIVRNILPKEEDQLSFFSQSVITKKVVDRMSASQKVGEIKILGQKDNQEQTLQDQSEICRVKVEMTKEEVQQLHFILVP